jgi:hypothetical protein
MSDPFAPFQPSPQEGANGGEAPKKKPGRQKGWRKNKAAAPVAAPPVAAKRKGRPPVPKAPVVAAPPALTLGKPLSTFAPAKLSGNPASAVASMAHVLRSVAKKDRPSVLQALGSIFA